MATSDPRVFRYRFPPFEADPVEGALWRRGNRVKLQDLPFRLLLMLLERPGEVVGREEVRQRMWPDGAYGDFDSSLSVAVRKIREALRDSPNHPLFIETIPKRGYRFIGQVEKVMAAAEPPGEKPSDTPAAPSLPSPLEPAHQWRRIAIAAAVVLVAAAAFLGVRALRSGGRHGSGRLTAAPPMRRSVAVLGFRNLPGRPEEAWLSGAFAEMLSTELAAARNMRLISEGEVARARRELPFSDADTLAKATLERLRVNVGADVVLLGSYTYTTMPGAGNRRLRLDLRLQDTASGEIIGEDEVTGTDDDLLELATEAGSQLRRNLGGGPPPAGNGDAVRAALPANESAIRFYSQGREKLWSMQYASARDLLTKAVAADPGYPLGHAALSEAFWHLGYEEKAREEAQRAFDLSKNLSREDQLLIEGQYRTTTENWPRAVEVYKTLFDLYPDNLEYGLLFADAQQGIDPKRALITLESLKRLPPPAGDDPRIDLSESTAWITQDVRKGRAAAERVIAAGIRRGSHFLVAHGHGILCQQGAYSGADFATVVRECEDARQSYAAAADWNNAARTLNDLAGAYFEQGDLTEAEKMYRSASAEFRQVGDLGALSASLNNIGAVDLVLGDLPAATAMLHDAVRLYEETGDKDGIALALVDLANVDALEGRFVSAETTYQQARSTAQEIDDNSALAWTLMGMGDVQLDRGNLDKARKCYEQALALRTKVGLKQAIAESKLALARVAVEQGRSAEADATIRGCIDQFQRERERDDELEARVVLVRALLSTSRYDEARRQAEQAAPVAAKVQNRLVLFRYSLASSAALVASGRPEQARPQLEKTIRDAVRLGFAGIELEARLTLGELDERSGRGAAARSELNSLQRAASAKEFGLIAQKATSAQRVN